MWVGQIRYERKYCWHNCVSFNYPPSLKSILITASYDRVDLGKPYGSWLGGVAKPFGLAQQRTTSPNPASCGQRASTWESLRFILLELQGTVSRVPGSAEGENAVLLFCWFFLVLLCVCVVCFFFLIDWAYFSWLQFHVLLRTWLLSFVAAWEMPIAAIDVIQYLLHYLCRKIG